MSCSPSLQLPSLCHFGFLYPPEIKYPLALIKYSITFQAYLLMAV